MTELEYDLVCKDMKYLIDSVWLACAIDGEGTISLQVNHYTPEISVTGTNFAFVEKAAKIMETKVSVVKRQFTEKYRIGNREPDRWAICYSARQRSMSKIKALLERVLPFLIIKACHAKLMIEFCELRENKTYCEVFGRSPREDEIFLKLKELNRKGVK